MNTVEITFNDGSKEGTSFKNLKDIAVWLKLLEEYEIMKTKKPMKKPMPMPEKAKKPY